MRKNSRGISEKQTLPCRNPHLYVWRVFAEGTEYLRPDPPGFSAPGHNGLEASKRLSHKSRIIFITFYRKYAVDAFEVEAVHYLLKPVTDERLYQAMDRALKRSKHAEDRTLIWILEPA